MPSVSVLMPIGRIDAYIPAAIQSVLNQKAVELELIITGPLAGSAESAKLQQLLNTEFGNDSRIKHQPRTKAGIANALNDALNEALTLAGTTYLARMDADDICAPNRLAEQVALSKQLNDQCLLGCEVELFSEEGPIQTGNQSYQKWLNALRSPADIHNSCLVESPLPHPTWFAHRSVWEKQGPYAQGDFPEDYEWLLRAWLNNVPMAKPQSTLLRWREHPNRLTRTDKRYQREAFIKLKANALCHRNSPIWLQAPRRAWIAGTGRNARYWHDALSECGAEVAGFVDLDSVNRKQSKRQKPVIGYSTLKRTLHDDLLVSAITQPDARIKLKHWLGEQGFTEGRQFVMGG